MTKSWSNSNYRDKLSIFSSSSNYTCYSSQLTIFSNNKNCNDQPSKNSMTGFIRCFSSIADCFYGSGDWSSAAAAGKAAGGAGAAARQQQARAMPEVTLDSANMGKNKRSPPFFHSGEYFFYVPYFRSGGCGCEERFPPLRHRRGEGVGANRAEQSILGGQGAAIGNLELRGN